ncbi:MAG: hypothetical protein FWD66_06835 [Paludibacter sp.]|nr:hypothetical protein [Paludibacter sp.]
MKRLILIFILFIIMLIPSMNSTISQQIQTTECKVKISYCTATVEDSIFTSNYELKLLFENRYILVANVWGDDLYSTFMLSQGKYAQDNNNIICTDDVYNFKLFFRNNKSGLNAKQIYTGLTNILFNKSTDFEEVTYFISNSKNIATIKLENTNKSEYHTLYYGSYGGLKLIKPNIYEYYYDENLLSKGTFKRNGKTNELELFDIKLQKVWQLFFIEEKRLIDARQGYVLFFESVSKEEKIKYIKERNPDLL